MSSENLRVIQISRWEREGGIARIAGYLHREYRARGIDASRAVSRKDSRDPTVWELPEGNAGTANLLGLPCDTVIHLHSLDSWRFDLAALPDLSQRFHVVLHLHDAWLFTGGCSHFLDCEGWQSGCENCTTLSESIPKHVIADNWMRKRDIFKRSRLFVISPCEWLMGVAKESMLAPAISESCVIPHGVDAEQFHPRSKQQARAELGLHEEGLIVLFVNNGAWRNYDLVMSTITSLRKFNPAPFILCAGPGLGSRKSLERVLFVNKVSPKSMPAYFQAADIYVHPARADTYPNVVLEALACGLPVVATDVGGLAEQVREGVTGYLFEPDMTFNWLAAGAALLLRREVVRRSMSQTAARDARVRFSLRRMTDDFLECYARPPLSVSVPVLESAL